MANKDQQSCTRLSIANPSQISDIVEWRESYNYTSLVNVKQFGSCATYLVEDDTSQYNHIKIPNTNKNLTSIQPSTLKETFDLTPPNCHHYSDCKVTKVAIMSHYSIEFNVDILVGMQWYLKSGKVLTYNGTAGTDQIVTVSYIPLMYQDYYGNDVDYGQIDSFNVTQMTYEPTTCEGRSFRAVVGFSFETNYGFTAQFGQADCVTNQLQSPSGDCFQYHTKAPNSTFINSIYGNATFVYEDSDPTSSLVYCLVRDFAAIDSLLFYGFGEPMSVPPYEANPLLATTYPDYNFGYIYTDVEYEDNVMHEPYDLGCSDGDIYSMDNMVDLHLSDTRKKWYCIFLFVCFITSVLCVVLRGIIGIQKIQSDSSEDSKLEVDIHEYFITSSVWKSLHESLLFCCYSKNPSAYVSHLLMIFEGASQFPITIAAPTNPRKFEFHCFDIWKGIYDTKSSKAFSIIWIVVACSVALYTMLYKQSRSDANPIWVFCFVPVCGVLACLFCQTDEAKDTLRELFGMAAAFIKWGAIALTVGTLCALYILSKMGNVTTAKSFVSILVTGVNFPDLGETMNARLVDRVPLSAPAVAFIGFQFFRLAYFVLICAGYMFPLQKLVKKASNAI